MLRKILIPSIAALLLLMTIESCTKCHEPVSPCQSACEMDPMKGFCGTPPVTFKYYFNQTTRQCEEYIHVGDDIPFETLSECESCSCTRLINEEDN